MTCIGTVVGKKRSHLNEIVLLLFCMFVFIAGGTANCFGWQKSLKKRSLCVHEMKKKGNAISSSFSKHNEHSTSSRASDTLTPTSSSCYAGTVVGKEAALLEST